MNKTGGAPIRKGADYNYSQQTFLSEFSVEAVDHMSEFRLRTRSHAVQHV